MLTRPTGTVTFLFTDVQGSTRLWEEHPQAMRAALARHDFLLSQAIQSHEGFIAKHQGDGFYAVFSNPASHGYFTEMRRLAEEEGELKYEIMANSALGGMLVEQMEYEPAAELLRESLELERSYEMCPRTPLFELILAS